MSFLVDRGKLHVLPIIYLWFIENKNWKNMYTYHSARNRIQLIGRVATDPIRYETERGFIIRIVLEVCERDDNYERFSSFHVVIIPNDRVKPCICTEFEKRDKVLVQGRLNNYKDEKTGKVISNIQASEVTVLNYEPSPPMTPEEKEKHDEKVKRLGEQLRDPEYWQGVRDGTIVSLFDVRNMQEDDDDGEVDENGRVEDEYSAFRKWKRNGEGWEPPF
jgi:hypothetical protein